MRLKADRRAYVPLADLIEAERERDEAERNLRFAEAWIPGTQIEAYRKEKYERKVAEQEKELGQ